MSLTILRKKREKLPLRHGQEARSLFAGADPFGAESFPVVVTGRDGDEIGAFLSKGLASAACDAAGIVVVSSLEGPGEILESLMEAMHALFPEVEVEPPQIDELVPWAMAVERATRNLIVDLQRRLLVIENFDWVLRSTSVEQKRFAETVQQLARQRSIMVVLGIPEAEVEECSSLPGLSHLVTRKDLIPIICPRDGTKPLALTTDRVAQPILESNQAALATAGVEEAWFQAPNWRVAGSIALLVAAVSLLVIFRKGSGGETELEKRGTAVPAEMLGGEDLAVPSALTPAQGLPQVLSAEAVNLP